MEKIKLADQDFPVKFHVSGRNQGQIVEVAYAAFGGENILRRTHDRSDQSTRYEIATQTDAETDRDADYWQREPSTDGDWSPVDVVDGPSGTIV